MINSFNDEQNIDDELLNDTEFNTDEFDKEFYINNRNIQRSRSYLNNYR